ncbi:hypothetical protein AN643_03700 [Candidatus Epulonipiscioides saccharophilum]|nr:hypothetical protein AN643_03700 [Epulopiscium sp. SCG-B10WGA-EpuloB]
MIRTALGKTGMEVSKIIYGAIISKDDGQEKSDEYVRYAIEKGVNYFDISPTYGDSQERLGQSLKGYRKDIYIAAKTNRRKGEEAKKEIEESLRVLNTDYFDVYQLHSVMSPDDMDNSFKEDGVMPLLMKYKEEGIIKNIGITVHSEYAALRGFELYDFDTLLFPTNWGLNMARGFGDKIHQVQEEKGFGMIGMKSLIHRAWLNPEEKARSRFPKSWCKPITEEPEFAIAAMRYAQSIIGASSLIPPGNIENFSFCVENVDRIAQPLTEKTHTYYN